MLVGGFATGQLCFHFLELGRSQTHETKNDRGRAEDCPLEDAHVFDAIYDSTEDFGEEFRKVLHDPITDFGRGDFE